MITTNTHLYKCKRERKRGRPKGGSIKNCACTDCTNYRNIEKGSMNPDLLIRNQDKLLFNLVEDCQCKTTTKKADGLCITETVVCEGCEKVMDDRLLPVPVPEFIRKKAW